jgi:hypothetical protein
MNTCCTTPETSERTPFQTSRICFTRCRDDVLDDLLQEREEVAAQRKAGLEAVQALQEAAKVGIYIQLIARKLCIP